MDGIVQILPLRGIPRIRPGDRLVEHILRAVEAGGEPLEDTDVVVVTQKVVSKSEGRLIRVEDIRPSPRALKLAKKLEKDPRTVQMILKESKRVVRQGHGVLIVETRHGFICANAGIDQSNVEDGYLTLLPEDPDVSARKLRKTLEKATGKKLAVVITDTFGRPWRDGHVDVAIGCSGITPLEDLVGTTDPYGHKLRVTQPAMVDEIAAASELVMRKHSLTPACVVRGVIYRRGYRGIRSIVREEGWTSSGEGGEIDEMSQRVVALAGGTGSAKLLRGLQAEVGDFTVISNVGDNFWSHGLYVCPDVDIAMYTLAGVADIAKGWGLQGDSFNVLSQLGRIGEETWFRLGDKDLATHIFRTEQMDRSKRLGEITTLLCERFGVTQLVLPCTEDRLETYIGTNLGDMHLQEFWVKYGGNPEVTGVEYRGGEGARPERRVVAEIEGADRIVFCPANPVTSILPILAVEEVRRAVERSDARRVAVSPMIGEAPISGPAGKLMKAIGEEPTSASVARLLYKGLIDVMLIDPADAPRKAAIEANGMKAAAASILMKDREDESGLARAALET